MFITLLGCRYAVTASADVQSIATTTQQTAGHSEAIATQQRIQYLQPKVRIEPLSAAVSVVFAAQLRPWLEHQLIVTPESIRAQAYVLGNAEQRITVGEGQTVYAYGAELIVGERYGIYRQGEPYLLSNHAKKNQLAALELTQVASATAIALQQGLSTLEINKSYAAEVRAGDLILPSHQHDLADVFYPSNSQGVLKGGQIIRVMGSIKVAAKNSVVTLNRGQQQGAQAGQVMSIYQQGEWVKDPNRQGMINLPHQNVGYLMIFKTFDQFSYAYILESALPIKMGAWVQAPTQSEYQF